MVGFVTFNREPDRYLFTYVLRPGYAPAKQGVIGILRRVMARLREDFPRARILALRRVTPADRRVTLSSP